MAPFTDKIAAQIQKIPSKTRMYGFGVFILILCGLFVYFFHIPMTTKIKQLEKDVAGLRATIKANDEKIKKLADLKAEVKTLEERLKLMTEQLPPGSEVSGLLRQIQNLVTQSGLTLKLWRPDKRKAHSSGLYEEIPINIELTGGYHNLAVFFDRVSKLTRIVNTLNLKMSGATMNKAGSVEIKINCTAMTFAAVEKKTDAVPVPATAVKKAN
jgi:type IV pilus assembly protein PilO